MPEPCVLVLTTMPAVGDAAARLARTLVDERLAACANVLPPMTSVYRWKDAVEEDEERQVMIKTTRARTAELSKRLRELHPYDVPEFIVIPIDDGSNAYLEWIRESTNPIPTEG